MKGKPHILFSAHGLPEKYVQQGDPYPVQVRQTVELVAEKLHLMNNDFSLAWQSKVGPVKWLRPSTNEAIISLARSGVKSLLIVPVSFVADNLETLHEIDIEYMELAMKNGISEFWRSKVFNDDGEFIKILGRLAAGAMRNK
jgi:ferrochelatase